ncbi:MAG: DUF763 domain-containing protein [bacterium]|nr:DUF763 domain-containing protein [bacterium]
MQRGVATFTLDWGKCPPWLFRRMVSLGREMTETLIAEYGPDEFVKRLADPVWFQSLGTVLAFDWNASGLTTILTAALKESIRGQERDLGVFICGGKGKTSRKTPDEIMNWGQKLSLSDGKAENLVYNSKMSAKVDSSLIQDGYQIYHHSFIFSKNGAWAVVQQGMNTEEQTARRYHWFSDDIKDLVVEPHKGIASQRINKLNSTLNMSSKKSDKNRQISTELVNSNYKTIMKDIEILRRHSSDLSQMISYRENNGDKTTLASLARKEFKTHPVMVEDFGKSKYLERILGKLTDEKPDNYESLLATKGVGPKTIRALSLVSEIIYGADASYEDPARYSFAHGGKDATPYPVDKETYDKTINTMREVVKKTRINPLEKDKIYKRLSPL